jgi:hypothetical protein
MTPADPSGNDRSAPEQLADWVLFAPLGLALEARRLFPEMAARGRRQILFTRTVGKYALRRGLVNGLLPTDAAAPPAEATIGTANNLVAVDNLPADISPDSDHLAIPDYDNLSAFQVMPRLEALDPTDLDAVRAYEESTRGRRTILNKIAQLS